MQFNLTILGCNAALPANGRHPSAHALNIHEHCFLIDCGEGTQMRMNSFGIRKSRIHHIFISHLHGDHIFGLIGLLTSMSLGGRESSLEIFSPPGLRQIIQIQLDLGAGHLTYPLHFREINPEAHQLIFENKELEVYSLPLLHRVPTAGYLFREKRAPLNIRPEKISEHNIPFTAIPDIKAGADYHTPSGKCISNEELTLPPRLTRSFAYCSDTAYHEGLVPLIKGVDLLYHEATFANDKKEHAPITMHSTAQQAASIASQAAVGQLILGHYSSRYKDVNVLLNEAKAVFENTVLGEEGRCYELPARRATTR
ncbi:MAG: ribonuclease Z [Bacteroidota bacterium]